LVTIGDDVVERVKRESGKEEERERERERRKSRRAESAKARE
jgi:hypothetical protein